MNNIEKLNQLYAAARLAPLNAEQHEIVRKLANELATALSPEPSMDPTNKPRSEDKK
jgi:hypothetical protein